MRKVSFEELNKVNAINVPGSQARVYVTYKRPQKNDQSGSISVVVSGWITSNKKRYPFKGMLVKNVGTDFKPSTELADSLEDANVKAGNPIKDTYSIASDTIADGVPFDAMADFFAGIRKQNKTTPRTTKKPKQNEKPEESSKPVVRQLKKNTPVEINIDKINSENQKLYAELLEKYPDMEEEPYGIVFDDSGDNVSVIFQNKNYHVIPKKYLVPRRVERNNIERDFQNAYKYYMSNRQSSPESINLDLLNAILNYKKNHNIPLDQIDQDLLKLKTEEKNKNNKNILQRIFKK